MNGIEKITNQIHDEAAAQAEAIISEAKTQAEAVLAEYREKADRAYEELLSAQKAEALAEADRIKRGAQLQKKKDILSAKQELIAEAYTKARDMLLSMPPAEYIAFLTAKAEASIISGSEILIFNAKDRELYGEKIAAAVNEKLLKDGKKAAVSLSGETRDIAGGLFVKDGNVEVNCTIDSLIEHIHDELDVKAAQILFEL